MKKERRKEEEEEEEAAAAKKVTSEKKERNREDTNQLIRVEKKAERKEERDECCKKRDRQTIGFAAGRVSYGIFLSLSLVFLLLSFSLSSRYTLARFFSCICVLSRCFQL